MIAGACDGGADLVLGYLNALHRRTIDQAIAIVRADATWLPACYAMQLVTRDVSGRRTMHMLWLRHDDRAAARITPRSLVGSLWQQMLAGLMGGRLAKFANECCFAVLAIITREVAHSQSVFYAP